MRAADLGPGVAGEERQRRRQRHVALHLVDRALLRVDQRRQLREQHPAHRDEVALALQHARELRQVGLQPVLLLVALGGAAQVVDHRVDVVLEIGDLAARLDLNRSGEVALGHGGRDLGDGAHLVGEVRREQVDVAGEVLPRARRFLQNPYLSR